MPRARVVQTGIALERNREPLGPVVVSGGEVLRPGIPGVVVSADCVIRGGSMNASR